MEWSTVVADNQFPVSIGWDSFDRNEIVSIHRGLTMDMIVAIVYSRPGLIVGPVPPHLRRVFSDNVKYGEVG